MNWYEVKVLAAQPNAEPQELTEREMAVSKMDAIVQVFDKLHDTGWLVVKFPTVKYLEEVH